MWPIKSILKCCFFSKYYFRDCIYDVYRSSCTSCERFAGVPTGLWLSEYEQPKFLYSNEKVKRSSNSVMLLLTIDFLRTFDEEVSWEKILISFSNIYLYLDLYSLVLILNPFQANVLLLYTLKTSENLCFSDVFRGYRNGTLTWSWLAMSLF